MDISNANPSIWSRNSPWPLILLVSCLTLSAQELTRPLVTCAQVRLLPDTVADSGLPVQLEAIVTLVDRGGTVFIQDVTGGSFIQGPSVNTNLVPGDLLRITGSTKKGLFVPGIDCDHMTVIGEAPLPNAPQVTYADLMSGRHNYQRVEVQGVLRRMTRSEEGYWLAHLAMGLNKLEIHIFDPAEEHGFAVDSELAVTGLAAGFINNRRQLVAPHLRLSGFDQVRLLHPEASIPPPPVVHANELLQYRPVKPLVRRVQVNGVVTYQNPGESLFLQDGETGLMIKCTQTNKVAPGDLVEVVGFPTMGPFSAYLDDATFTLSGTTHQPASTPSTSIELLRGALDAKLVSIDCQLLEIQTEPDSASLVLQGGSHVFKAHLKEPLPEGFREQFPLDSRVEVTGICIVEEAGSFPRGFSSGPSSFSILMASPLGITMLSPPDWWTSTRLATALQVLFILLLAGGFWAWTLQQRIRSQTRVIRDQTEKESVLEERQRIAREFHDTLEQELVGLSLHLDAISAKLKDDQAKPLFNTARGLLHRVQDEARHIVWNLRDDGLSKRSLYEDLEKMAKERSAQSGVEILFEGGTDEPPLPGIIRHHLRRIAQESVTNALKHGQPSHVRIRTLLDQDNLTLEISDNGGGSLCEDKDGHFGILGMKERTRKIGASIRWESNGKGGVTVRLLLPLAFNQEGQ